MEITWLDLVVGGLYAMWSRVTWRVNATEIQVSCGEEMKEEEWPWGHRMYVLRSGGKEWAKAKIEEYSLAYLKRRQEEEFYRGQRTNVSNRSRNQEGDFCPGATFCWNISTPPPPRHMTQRPISAAAPRSSLSEVALLRFEPLAVDDLICFLGSCRSRIFSWRQRQEEPLGWKNGGR